MIAVGALYFDQYPIFVLPPEFVQGANKTETLLTGELQTILLEN